MVDFRYKDSYGVKDSKEIVRLLRVPGGCPWDTEQTHQSVHHNFLKETYEVVKAIDEGSPEHPKEELGDVSLQVVFHALMEQEAGRFDLDAVADSIYKELVFRHPRILGEVSISGAGEVFSNWEELKRKEKGQATNTDALEVVARFLPALWRAEKVQKEAKEAGFDWPDVSDTLDKLSEELEELKTTVAEGINVEEKPGNLLFSVVNTSRLAKVDAEEALNRATNRFIDCFRKIEEEVVRQGYALEGISSVELDKLWEHAKET